MFRGSTDQLLNALGHIRDRKSSGVTEASIAGAAVEEIERLQQIEKAVRAVLDDMEVGDWSQYEQDVLADALNVMEG